MARTLTERFLATNSPAPRPARRVDPEKDFTSQVEVTGDNALVEIRAEAGKATEDVARERLLAKGLNPDEWEVSGFRSSEWTLLGGGLGESNRFSFRRTGAVVLPKVPIDELIAAVGKRKPCPVRPQGDAGFVMAIGDMQFGKVDGDGVEGTLSRTIEYINKAADTLEWYRKRFDIGHVHCAWLGDHIEGFVSQGGTNVARTQLPLNEQIRLTRRVMLHAMDVFAPMAQRVTMAAVPGNHGESQRIGGKGVTRYDDNHDTECLVAVADAAALNEKAFGHVEFYVPQPDEMTVVLDVAGTVVAHAHGHQWRPGKHFDWWEGQSFGNPSLHQSDLLLAGHLHHEFMESRGSRLFLQVPALESESTWYRHSTGGTGNPGLMVGITRDGATNNLEIVR